MVVWVILSMGGADDSIREASSSWGGAGSRGLTEPLPLEVAPATHAFLSGNSMRFLAPGFPPKLLCVLGMLDAALLSCHSCSMGNGG